MEEFNYRLVSIKAQWGCPPFYRLIPFLIKKHL